MRAKRGFFAAFGLRSHNNLQKIYDWDGNLEFIRAVWTDSSRGAAGGREPVRRAKEGGRSAAGEGGPAGAPDGSGGCARRGSGAGSGQAGGFGWGKRDAPPWAHRQILQLKHPVQQASEDRCPAAEGREYRKFTG